MKSLRSTFSNVNALNSILKPAYTETISHCWGIMQHHTDSATDTGPQRIWEAMLTVPALQLSSTQCFHELLEILTWPADQVLPLLWWTHYLQLQLCHLHGTQSNTWNNTGQRLGIKLCPHSGDGQNSHWVTKQLIGFWIKTKIKIWILFIIQCQRSEIQSGF